MCSHHLRMACIFAARFFKQPFKWCRARWHHSAENPEGKTWRQHPEWAVLGLVDCTVRKGNIFKTYCTICQSAKFAMLLAADRPCWTTWKLDMKAKQTKVRCHQKSHCQDGKEERSMTLTYLYSVHESSFTEYASHSLSQPLFGWFEYFFVCFIFFFFLYLYTSILWQNKYKLHFCKNLFSVNNRMWRRKY